jgi:non-specific serine/threonine protein kinase
VLDNCEHVVDACAALADALLRACPDLRVLATSREALGVAGEAPHRVPSLALPDPARPPPVEALAAYEAVRLFVERAAIVQPGFALTARNAAAVAQVCARLDGIPLALELAAARVRVLPLEQLLPRLEDRFRLLTGGGRTAPVRHQTLRAAVDWSYALLAAPERALFARLSVFAGGWDLEAAEAVGAGDGIGAEAVLDLLTRLADTSLVVAEAPPAGGGGARYRLLETLRQYAGERLREGWGGAAAARRRHAAHYLALAEAARPPLQGAAQLGWLARLEAEGDNLRAALRWYLDGGDAAAAVRLAAALSPFWYLRHRRAEAQAWLAELLALPGLAGAPRARALGMAGHVAGILGDGAGARRLLEEGLALARGLGDDALLASALNQLGGYRLWRGDYPAARALYEEALALFRRRGDHSAGAYLLTDLGLLWHWQGEAARARAAFEEVGAAGS